MIAEMSHLRTRNCGMSWHAAGQDNGRPLYERREAADTAKGTLYTTAPAPDPTGVGHRAHRPPSSSSMASNGSTRTLASSRQVPSSSHRSLSNRHASSVRALGSISQA
jgi:hypothetical protein